MIILIITNILILIMISVMLWWRWKERSLNKKLENVILTVPQVEEVPLKVREIRGEVIPGRVIEDEAAESDEETIEMREYLNEQRWLNRRKQPEN